MLKQCLPVMGIIKLVKMFSLMRSGIGALHLNRPECVWQLSHAHMLQMLCPHFLGCRIMLWLLNESSADSTGVHDFCSLQI